MMLTRSWFVALVLGSLVVLSSGCAKSPEDLAGRTEQALEAARTAGAPEYAPEAWRAADDAFARARTEAQAQSKRFALIRKYKAAEVLYEEALQLANRARSAAEEAKTRAHDDADALLVAVRQQLAGARALLDSEKGRALLVAPRSGPALEQLRTELEDLERNLSGIDRAIVSGDFAEALRMGQAARDQAGLVESNIFEVLETGRPPRRDK